MAVSYSEFIKSKTRNHEPSGVLRGVTHPKLFDFQSAVTRWALHKGRSSVFAGTGLGKTLIQSEFMRNIQGTRLIVAPLAVAAQTVREATMVGLDVVYAKSEADIVEGACHITNYDRVEAFACTKVDAVVLDESSILKSHDGAYRKYLTDRFSGVKYRLCCTATPSPNDVMELATHAEFVGAMTRSEMLATFFTHDGGDTSKWRLKRHARKEFWKWVASWACCFANPSDIGFDGSRFVLPDLRWHQHTVDSEAGIAGGLFGTPAVDATDLGRVLKASEPERVVKAVELAESTEQVCVWCNYDSEQAEIVERIHGAVSVKGSDSQEHKERSLLGFADGAFRVLVTKPKIAGFGMNWQNCHQTVFASVSFSFEAQYQAVRRFYRFGQKSPVDAHIVCADTDESVRASLSLKARSHEEMAVETREFCRKEIEQYA